MRKPRDTQLTCSECGFQTKLTTAGLAKHSIRLHSCDRHKESRERSERFWARLGEVDRTPKPCLHIRVKHEHGTRLGYTLDRCRCWPCTKAGSDADVRVRKDRAYGRSIYTPSDVARAHVNALRSAGWGVKTISAAAGVSGSALTKLIWGYHGRPPSVRITRATEARILAVPLPTVHQLGGTQQVPAVGAMRRLRALATLGWSTQEMCRRAGMGYQGFYAVISGKYETCYVRTWLAIEKLYDELWDKFPAETNKGERSAAVRTRNRAVSKGWVSPLGWDDDSIDDPKARPSTGDMADRIDAFMEDAIEMWEYGLDPERILRNLDVTAAAAAKRFHRRRPEHQLTTEFNRLDRAERKRVA